MPAPPIIIDRRTGSVELVPLFKGLALPHTVGELAYGDFSIEGNTAKGVGLIGIERKRVTDLLQCMCDGRYVGHQLPGMLNYYDHSYLIVEGITRPAPHTGILQYAVEDSAGKTWWRDVTVFKRRRFMWRDFDGFITTLEHSKTKVRRTDNAQMTVATVGSLYHWYTHKKWQEHDSLKALYSTPYAVMTLEDKSSIVRRIAKELGGIGVDKSLAVCMKFRTPFDMITAESTDWMSIPGIGPTIAERVMREIHGTPERESRREGDE
jgi:ERCC4-type nuclease